MTDDEVWAASGLAWLTGRPDGPPLAGPDALVPIARQLLGDLPAGVPAEQLLVDRAAVNDFTRNGTTSAGGACHLLSAADGWVAVNLARDDDVDLLPAWLGITSADDLPEVIARHPAAALADRAQVLGLPVAVLPDGPDEQRHARPGLPPHVSSLGPPSSPRRPADVTVVDLSSLWAGPLCAHLLGRAGARVVKVESASRPDGARLGPPEFFDLLHDGHESLVIDLADLRAVLDDADVVIEGSRPRALDQLGIHPVEVAAAWPGLVWVSVTAYGRTGPWANRVGFGDDTAVAGGLVARDEHGPVFCADAVSDPLVGMAAASAVVAALAGGGGVLVDVALREMAALVAEASTSFGRPLDPATVSPPILGARKDV